MAEIEIRCTGKTVKRGICGKLFGKIKKDKKGNRYLEIRCRRCGKNNIYRFDKDMEF